MIREDQSLKLKPAPLPDLNDPLLAVIDRQLEIERKARAWDELLVVLALNARDGCGASGRLLTHAEALVHPAQLPASAKS